MAITQMQCLLTIWLKISHFIRSVLDHGKYGTKLKLLPMEVYSCVVCEFLVVAMKTTAKKIHIFCKFCEK